MIFLVSNPEKYKEFKDAGHTVIAQEHGIRTAARLAKDGCGRNFRDLYGTAKGSCLILGMGPSREKLTERPDIPVIGINRAALSPFTTYWLSHDIDAVDGLWGQIPESVPLITYACNWLKSEYSKYKDSRREVYFYDIFPDPTKHAKRPIYWNATTLGVGLDLCVRMGFKPIYTLGCDLTEGGYVNPKYSAEELKVEHKEVYRKMLFMFRAQELLKWNPRPAVPIIDLSGGKLPVYKKDYDEFRSRHCGRSSIRSS